MNEQKPEPWDDHMTHEETIKRIQELVPSIMELEFGCEVDTGVKRIVLEKRGNRIQTYAGGIVFTNKIEQLGNFQILGKPITLAVVMLAIATEFNPKNTSTFLSIDSNGEFCWTTTTDLRGGTMKITEPIVSWNLSKDNFNDQSEETKTFIGGLLDWMGGD